MAFAPPLAGDAEGLAVVLPVQEAHAERVPGHGLVRRKGQDALLRVRRAEGVFR